MRHKAKLTITRPSYGDGDRKISIQVKDVDARTRFLDIQIDYDKFAECVTGLSEIECDMEFRNMESVGKLKESKELVFEIPKASWAIGRDKVKDLAILNTPEGWTCSTGFGSKNSFFDEDDKYFARTSISRWVDK